jgi:Tfp pilus assembly protein PilW
VAKSGAPGFSLLELLVASAIFFSFMVGVSLIYSHGHHSYRRGQSRIEVHQNARIATETMLRELRRAGYDPSGAIPQLTPQTTVQAAESSLLTFVTDVDADGVTDRVTYRQRGAELLREVSSWSGSSFPPPAVDQLADGLSAFTLTYHGTSSPIPAPVATASLGAVRRVGIAVVATRHEAGIQESFPLAVDVCLRNQD